LEKQDKVLAKLAVARTRLILDQPFLGALVLRMPLQVADPAWCLTATTDAKKIYYNYEYIHQLHLSETQFVLAKQALHCAFSHFARRGHRIKQRWDLACDYAINPLLIEEGFTAPPGSLVEDSFKGMSAEEIYRYLDDKDEGDADTGNQESQGSDKSEDPTNSQPSNNHSGNNSESDQTSKKDPDEHSAQPNSSSQRDDTTGSPEPSPLSKQEEDNLSVQWQQRLAGAAQQAQQAGKLSESMARMVEFILQPKLPWRALLAKHMTATARDDYNYARPSSRRGDPVIFPSLRSAQTDIVVALDVSGSLGDREIDEFMSEVNAIKAQLRARISLLICDAKLADGSPWIFESWDEFKLPRTFSGGGGTDFRPVFNWVEQLDQRPELLLYFSDCEGIFPNYAPDYAVIWLVKGRAQPPFGQRIQLN